MLPEIQLDRQVDQGHVVVQLDVTDADAGINAAINYVTLRQVSNNDNPIFGIDSTTGDIFTLRLVVVFLSVCLYFCPYVCISELTFVCEFI